MVGYHFADVHNGTPLASNAQDFRLAGVQSVMANPTSLFRFQMTPLAHLASELISDRGNA
jgi:hypothetical protein